jgi:geranylgeranylglycerol-phosphate geranylgeranyltransferase
LRTRSPHGILSGYPQIRKRFGKISVYLQLIRPFTLLAPLLAGILGVLATTSLSFDYLFTAIYVGVTLALAQAVGQVINQYADVELDKIVKPYRPLPSGLLTREEALGVAWLLALVSIARSFTISTFFGLLTLTMIFFAVFYSLSPFSPRRVHAVLNVLWMAFSRGFLPVVAVWSIHGTFEKALPYALLAFIWVLAFQSTKDIEDVDGDRKFKIKTMFSAYGYRGLRVWMIVCSIIYTVVTAYFGLHLMLALMFIAGWSFAGISKKSRFTENNIGWTFYYIGLAFVYVLMFLSERLG